METPNTASLGEWWKRLGADDDRLLRVFRSFNAEAGAFRAESEAREQG
jgi:hypothetical protein